MPCTNLWSGNVEVVKIHPDQMSVTQSERKFSGSVKVELSTRQTLWLVLRIFSESVLASQQKFVADISFIKPSWGNFLISGVIPNPKPPDSRTRWRPVPVPQGGESHGVTGQTIYPAW